MSATIEQPTDLVILRFSNGVEARYTKDFRVVIFGDLWPRQLRAIHEVIQRYKECSKDDRDNQT